MNSPAAAEIVRGTMRLLLDLDLTSLPEFTLATGRRVDLMALGRDGRQVAIEVKSWLYPPYLEEGLIDAVMARGPVWRDPATGRRAAISGAPKTYEERAWSAMAGTEEGTG